MAALPFALSTAAAAAGFAYLNGRHGFTYDYRLLSAFINGALRLALTERADQLNLFYELEKHARSARANHVWIIFQGKSWSYAQAYDVVLRYGTWLKSRGVEKDEIVAMDMVNGDAFIWVWFGLWSIGAKPAFINTNLTGQSLVHSIKTSTARLVVVDQECKDKFDDDVMRQHGFAPVDSQRADQIQYGFELDQSEIPKSVRNKSTTPKAAVEAGAVAEPLPTTRQRQLEIVFFDDALATQILALPPTRLTDEARNQQSRTDMGMLIYTSGTTGLPKAAVVGWNRCNMGSKFAADWLSLKHEVLYTSMPLYHSAASILGVCATLRAASTICLSKKFSHKTFWPEIRASNATIIHYVGETCRYLLSAPPSALDKQHKVHAAFGNGLRPDVWQPFKDRFGITTIYEIYAATEAPGGMWNRSSNAFSAGAIGRSGSLASLLFAPSLALIRMDPTSDPPAPLRSPTTGLCELCDPNEQGELVYKLDPKHTQDKFQGYFGNAAATEGKILRNVKVRGDAYFRSGDLLRSDKDGRWWFVDRTGDTFRWKAENVSTAEVAEALGRHPDVLEANVYGVAVPRHDGRAGCAALVLKSPASASSDQSSSVTTTPALPLPTEQTLASLAAHAQQHLPPFAVPLFLRLTREMHTTGTNKQQKTRLQADGIDPEKAGTAGDVLYWLSGGTYRRFGGREWERVEGGRVRL